MPTASPESSTAVVHARLAAARARLRGRDAHIVEMQAEVTRIAAPTGAEGERGKWIASRLRSAGLAEIHTDAAGNVVGTMAGTDLAAPPIVVCAHMDTVFPSDTPLTVQRDGPLLLAPGIGDNGRGLAVMLAVASELATNELRTRHPVIFAATVGEEGSGNLRGARALFAGIGAGAAGMVALDGAGDERIVHAALGSRRLRISFTGPGGHSWAAYGVPNPVSAAAATAAAVAAMRPPLTPRTTLSVTRIGGGTSVNSIPEDAWLEVDIRSTSGVILARLATGVVVAATAARDAEDTRRMAGSPPLRMDVQLLGDRPCGEVPRDDRLVRAAFEATRLVGRSPSSATASTDANIPIGLGIPAVAIGAGGRGGGAHTVGEWYDNTDGTLGVARALTLVATAAGLHNTG